VIAGLDRLLRRWGTAGRGRRAVPRPDAGAWGEQQAEQALCAKGYRILGRRVRVGRRDEIDLLARDGAVLVFVEVKTRRSEDYGRPASAVKRAKRHALSRAAVRYLKSRRERRVAFRFDVVEVVGAPGAAAPVVRHIANAFPLERRYVPPG
jgi:putative endonuclease